MLLKDNMIARLIAGGLSQQQAENVMTYAIPIVNRSDDYKFTWNRPANEYPQLMIEHVWALIKRLAYKWLCRNKPEAWFIPMFYESIRLQRRIHKGPVFASAV